MMKEKDGREMLGRRKEFLRERSRRRDQVKLSKQKITLGG